MPAESESTEFAMIAIGLLIAFGVAVVLVLYFVPQKPEWLLNILKIWKEALGIFGV